MISGELVAAVKQKTWRPRICRHQANQKGSFFHLQRIGWEPEPYWRDYPQEARGKAPIQHYQIAGFRVPVVLGISCADPGSLACLGGETHFAGSAGSCHGVMITVRVRSFSNAHGHYGLRWQGRGGSIFY